MKKQEIFVIIAIIIIIALVTADHFSALKERVKWDKLSFGLGVTAELVLVDGEKMVEFTNTNSFVVFLILLSNTGKNDYPQNIMCVKKISLHQKVYWPDADFYSAKITAPRFPSEIGFISRADFIPSEPDLTEK